MKEIESNKSQSEGYPSGLGERDKGSQNESSGHSIEGVLKSNLVKLT